jgi:hypothetical protein
MVSHEPNKKHVEIKTKTVNIIHFPYLDLSKNVKIRDVPYSLKSPRNTECKLAHIYGMNKGKVFIQFGQADILIIFQITHQCSF